MDISLKTETAGILVLIVVAVAAFGLFTNYTSQGSTCTTQYMPVCGIDNKTYSNACLAGNVNIDYPGVCGAKANHTAPANNAGNANMANPASVFCEKNGGRLEIRGNDSGERGYCVFAGGNECEEWAFFRGACTDTGRNSHICTPYEKSATMCTTEYAPVCGSNNVTYGNGCSACASGLNYWDNGGCVKPVEKNYTTVTGANPASEYCDAMGGTLQIRDMPYGQVGFCILPDGAECEEWEYFRGECPAPEGAAATGGTQVQPGTGGNASAVIPVVPCSGAGCSNATGNGTVNPPPTGGTGTPGNSTNSTNSTTITPGNIADEFCVANHGTIIMRGTPDGQIGYCVLPSGNECERWAFFSGECTDSPRQQPTYGHSD
jgi:uncharacterized protein